MLGGLGAYAFGGPVIHLFHEQPKRALIRVGLAPLAKPSKKTLGLSLVGNF